MRIAVSRQPGAERDVSPLELFFDLVYVFAIGQLSHHLVAHVDLRRCAARRAVATTRAPAAERRRRPARRETAR